MGGAGHAGYLPEDVVIPNTAQLIVTFEGTEYILTKSSVAMRNYDIYYGGDNRYDDGHPNFVDGVPPCGIAVYNSGQDSIYTKTNGTYSIKIEVEEGDEQEEIELPAKLVCEEGTITNNLREGSSWETTKEAFDWIQEHSYEYESGKKIDIDTVALITSLGSSFDNKDSGYGWTTDGISWEWNTQNYYITLTETTFRVQYED